MNCRSGGTSILSPNCLESVWCEALRRSSKRSAMAKSLTGPPGAESALATAPLPRPPQPIKASLIVPSPAAWTCGTATPASAEVAANLPARPRNSRACRARIETLRLDRLMESSFARYCTGSARIRSDQHLVPTWRIVAWPTTCNIRPLHLLASSPRMAATYRISRPAHRGRNVKPLVGGDKRNSVSSHSRTSFTTKASPVPPPNLLCTAAGVTGKSGEEVWPTR